MFWNHCRLLYIYKTILPWKTNANTNYEYINLLNLRITLPGVNLIDQIQSSFFLNVFATKHNISNRILVTEHLKINICWLMTESSVTEFSLLRCLLQYVNNADVLWILRKWSYNSCQDIRLWFHNPNGRQTLSALA